jgi:hypothetical protein
LARRLYGYAFLADCVPLYPVYALLFADAGVSAAGISGLFALWSATSFLVEIPAGVWADVVSRRLLVAVAPLLEAAGYALWVLFPAYGTFAGGFVLLGAGNALRSGAWEALVYAELDRRGAAGGYARLAGRAAAAGGGAQLLAMALAAPLVAGGGYRLAGLVSVAALLACAGSARLLASPAGSAPGQAVDDDSEPVQEAAPESLATLRAGFRVVRGTPVVRRMVVLAAALTGVAALDEYLPLLARGTGAGTVAVPLLVLLVSAGSTVGGLLAGRGRRWLGPVLAVAGVLLAVGAASGSWFGLVAVAAAFGAFSWALAQADARLHDGVDDTVRATVGSMSGAAMEAAAVAAFGLYAAGSAWLSPRWLFTAAACPCPLLAVTMIRDRRRSSGGPAAGR